jgi:glycosyltransferase involved in cell wall biosynthesis
LNRDNRNNLTKRIPRIAIDFTSLDHLNLGSGQYRYVVDLITGLADYTQARFVVLGSRPEPVPELHEVLGVSRPNWSYRQMPGFRFRGGAYGRHVSYSAWAALNRVDLWHAPHSFIPFGCPCPVVVTEHDLMGHLFDEYRHLIDNREYRLYRRIVQTKTAQVICSSECTRRDLLRLFPMPEEKTNVVYLGTRFSRERVGDRSPVALAAMQSKLWLASPYNLEPRKNLRKLLLSLKGLLTEFPELRLVLFGRAAVTPEREAEFQSWLKQLDLETKVICTGYLQDEELTWVYRNCTAFVFPSLYEGFGLPVLESMAEGACVLVRSASAMTEIIGQAGVSTETNDPQLLQEELRKLLRSPAQRALLSQRGRQQARSFTVEAMARQTFDIYMRAMNQPTRAAAVATGVRETAAR